jgi:phosphoribosyl-AMP cyclohydrolase
MSSLLPGSPPDLFGADGLVPVVIQDASTDAVLMLGYMNPEALELTRKTGRAHFWSRSRRKLWRKGETSGHEQVVEEIFVNCESNSLLITVHQTGAVCHTGFPTCFYRRLEPDDSLTVVRDRWFDPADVYDAGEDSPTSLTRRWYGAYEFLRDNDLTTVSGTSQRLRDVNATFAGRVADELRELAGVMTGAHEHVDFESDVILEGSQSLYWLALLAVHAGITWDELRPDRALQTTEGSVSPESAARMLLGEAAIWQPTVVEPSTLAPRVHAAMALIAQASSSSGIAPNTLVERDLVDLRSRDHLAPYFERSS